MLIAVACFFIFGLGGLAVRLAYPQQTKPQATIITGSTDILLSATATPSHTPSSAPATPAQQTYTPTSNVTNTLLPSRTTTATPTRLTLSPSPTVTQTLAPNKTATALPAWATERYLPLPVGEKWIEVDISNQILRAYDGERLVYTATVATGRGITQATLGRYRITQKVAMKLITGPGYYLPDVPWVMVINSSLMLHGAYWQDSWGAPTNYGFINLKPADAKWLFDWSSPSLPIGEQSIQATTLDQGTWVIIHS